MANKRLVSVTPEGTSMYVGGVLFYKHEFTQRFVASYLASWSAEQEEALRPVGKWFPIKEAFRYAEGAWESMESELEVE